MIYEKIKQNIADGKKMLAVLIDPDKGISSLTDFMRQIKAFSPDFILVGGSLIFKSVEKTIETIKQACSIPVILFPGNALQFTDKADALLYLSLISGRNPEFLIGQHVTSSYAIKKSGIEVLSTGYILVDGGKPTSVEYMSNTMPVPPDKPEIAVATAVAGELLGHKLIYLEAGSGALHPIPANMIAAVKENTDVPLIVGGGLRTVADIQQALHAGADIVVVGNILEKNPELLTDFVKIINA
jgi:putative glycerol-1-phosphate prenyltransferase